MVPRTIARIMRGNNGMLYLDPRKYKKPTLQNIHPVEAWLRGLILTANIPQFHSHTMPDLDSVPLICFIYI